MTYVLANPAVVWGLLLRHLALTATALAAGVTIALPLGTLLSRRRRLAGPVLGALAVLYTVPSLALIVVLIPLFGLGGRSVVVALVLYAQVILVRNVAAGLTAVDPAALEAADGMGMTGIQRWWRVELPLALPVIMAGIRIAAIVTVAIAAIGAKFGAGGLGTLLFDGIAQTGRYDKIWAGALALAALALALNQGLLALERALDPRRARGYAAVREIAEERPG